MAITINGSGSITGVTIDSTDIEDGAVTPAKLSGTLGSGTSAQVLQSDGDGTFSWVDAAGGALVIDDVQFFNSSSNWTKSANAVYVEIMVSGGGGAGGGKGDNPRSCAGGGGAAGYYGFFNAADITNSPVAITVGAGGTATNTNGVATAGNSGGTSSFGNYVTCNGGGGGGAVTSGNVNTNASGGTASTNLTTATVQHMDDGQKGARAVNGISTDTQTTGGGKVGGQGNGSYNSSYGSTGIDSSNLNRGTFGSLFTSDQPITASAGGSWASNGNNGFVKIVTYKEL